MERTPLTDEQLDELASRLEVLQEQSPEDSLLQELGYLVEDQMQLREIVRKDEGGGFAMISRQDKQLTAQAHQLRERDKLIQQKNQLIQQQRDRIDTLIGVIARMRIQAGEATEFLKELIDEAKKVGL